jgi:hypothetical protein
LSLNDIASYCQGYSELPIRDESSGRIRDGMHVRICSIVSCDITTVLYSCLLQLYS